MYGLNHGLLYNMSTAKYHSETFWDILSDTKISEALLTILHKYLKKRKSWESLPMKEIKTWVYLI